MALLPSFYPTLIGEDLLLIGITIGYTIVKIGIIQHDEPVLTSV